MYLMAYECSHLIKSTQFPLQESHRCVFKKNQTKHINKLHEQNGDPINIKAVDAYTYR
jgi:hypothetical protein